MRQKEIWSFFTGAMGLDIGLEQAGLPATLAVEWDKDCCETIRQNCPKLDVWEEDINRVTASSLMARRGNPKEVFLMAGGPPCQSFSPGGSRAALSDPRGNLVYVFLRLIDQVRPRYFVFENVANIVTAALKHRPIAERPGQHWNLKAYETKRFASSDAEPMQPEEMSGSAIRQVFADMTGLGYHLSLGVLDAADYGAPQHRLRFVMIGSRDGDAPYLPMPTHGDPELGLAPFRTVRDAIFDLRTNPGCHSEYGESMARFFRLVPTGGNWRNLPKELQPEALGPAFEAGGGKCGFFRRADWDRPAPTVTGRSNRKGSAICHPEAHRPLSVRECARLQGFPDEWFFAGSMSQQYMQIGNAVPVHLGAALGNAILHHRRQVATVQTGAHLETALQQAMARLRGYACNRKSRPNRLPLLAEMMRE